MILESTLKRKVQEIGFSLVSEPHENKWDTIFIIKDKDEQIYRTTEPSNVVAWVCGYKHYTKEAWEI